MQSVFYRILGFILFFLYCANIGFVFFPGKIKTTLVISVVGLIYYFIRFHGKDPYKLRKIIVLIIPLAFWMLLSVLINQSDQPWFLQYVVLQVLYIFGAAFVVDVGKIDSIKYALILVSVYVLIQNLIAFLGMQMPGITNVISTLQHAKDDYYENLFEFRARGFGEHYFFTGGIWAALGILAITYLKKIEIVSMRVFVVVFITIFITGMFVARTAMTGIVALLLFLMPIKKNWYKLVLFLIGGALLIPATLYIEKELIRRDVNTGYAFEVIDTFVGTGSLKTGSSNRTIEMWNTIPTETKTWLIGDAKYTDNRSGGYYMHIDVGYLRVIFYGGVIGLLLYLLYTFKLCQLTYRRSMFDKEVKYFMFIYILFVLMFMWKGHSDTNHFLYLLLCAPMHKLIRKRLVIKS